VKFAEYVGDDKPQVVGNAILSRFGLADITILKVGTDDFGDRSLLCGHHPNLRHVRFCSAHLTPGDNAAAGQLGKVLNQLESWWNDRNDTVLLAGDLNLTADSPALDTIYSAAVNTPNNNKNEGQYREIDDADAQHCLGYGEGSLPGTAGGPCKQGGKIDFIFARENCIVNGDYEGDTLGIPTDCTGACSDHRPVIGRVKVRAHRD